MLIKIIKLLLRLDLKIKISKGYAINELYHNFIKEIGYVYSDMETEYYLNSL